MYVMIHHHVLLICWFLSLSLDILQFCYAVCYGISVLLSKFGHKNNPPSPSGMHPRVLVDGFEIAKRAALQFLEKFKTPVVMGNEPDKEILKMVARTTIRTKVALILSIVCLLFF